MNMTDSSAFEAIPCELSDVVRFRDMYRQEMNCQIRNDSAHARGFSQHYRLRCRGAIVGYGAVGDYDTQKRQVVIEFYVTPAYRADALPLFGALLRSGEATQVEAQTNDRLLLLMLYDVCRLESITSGVILFEDAVATSLPPPAGITIRRVPAEPPSGFQILRDDMIAEVDGVKIGEAGFLCHYNPPYGDVYMEVDEAYRERGIGSYLVQEIKKVCYEAGRRPSARCNVANEASRRTLQKAGFLPCARLLRGRVNDVTQ